MYSGNVRLKAVRHYMGLPLEVFVGNSLSDLHMVANNGPNNISITGVSGFINLRVTAGQTYYVRVDNDPRLPLQPWVSAGPDSVPDSVLTIEPTSEPLEGELNFSLIVGSYSRNGQRQIIPIARVFQSDRRTPLAGTEYKAQLYVGQMPNDLVPVGDAQPFLPRDLVPPSYAGLFVPAPVFVPNTIAGQRVFAQIRVWDSLYGNSFETARANGSPFGISNTIFVKTGSEETGGSMLLRIQNFTLQPGAHR